MADYSEFPTTPTAWQEQQLKDWQTVLPLSTEDTEPPRKRGVDLSALVPGVLFVVLAVVAMAGLDLPFSSGRTAVSSGCSSSAAASHCWSRS